MPLYRSCSLSPDKLMKCADTFAGYVRIAHSDDLHVSVQPFSSAVSATGTINTCVDDDQNQLMRTRCMLSSHRP
jgi:hypothetical protein